MNAGRTARDRARAELTREIKDEARRQLAASGADGLSLRAVARKLGMVSSALYRYFPSRDDLVTALIIDAYTSLGEAAEAGDAGVPRTDLTGRWRGTCRAVRTWALRHRHEYALIYGSPIPGYQAPRDTVAPAGRVPLVLLGILHDAATAGTLTSVEEAPLTPGLAEQAGTLAGRITMRLPEPVLVRGIMAWTQLFGMISFELFGQLVGSVDPSEDFFEYAIGRMAELVGLPPAAETRP